MTWPTSGFPASLDVITDVVDGVDYPKQNDINGIYDCIEKMQGKIGIDSSAVATSLDYLLKSALSVDPGHKHSSSSITVVNKGSLDGLEVSHAADTDHDITVAAGECADSTGAATMTLASALTKRADAEWVVGSTNGGMATGESLPTSGTVHLWLIKRSDTGVVDAMFNNHASSGLTPSLPTDYDYKRRIASFRTDGSANIINGVQWGSGRLRRFVLNTPILDVSNATPGTSAVTAALSVPAGIAMSALLNVYSPSGTPYISSLANADLAPSTSAAPLITMFTGVVGGVVTNTSSQIRYRAISNNPVLIATLGWEDSL